MARRQRDGIPAGHPDQPQEPPPTPWAFPRPAVLAGMPAGEEVVAGGADLAAATVLAGYRCGMFAMPEGRRLFWWSPDPRGVLIPEQVHVSRSMRPVLRHLEVSCDLDFPAVLAGCADPRRPRGWISRDYQRAYLELHALGWAHSVEVWHGKQLVAGLLGVEVGGLFAGESMFHVPTVGAQGSRVAVIALATLLSGGLTEGPRLIDVQWATDHLRTLGVQQLPRAVYLEWLPRLVALPPALHRSYRRALDGAPAASRIRWRTG